MSSFYERRGKRWFDCCAATLGLVALIPLFIVLAILVKVTSKGPVFYKQTRMGQQFKPFTMLKFRSMVVRQSDDVSLVTSAGDARITWVGAILRRLKLDELPQLFNVIKGEMSLVGPRPEVKRYINHYPLDYAGILRIKPGITDNAAIAFKHEEAILADHDDVESAYIEDILPKKIKMYHEYAKNISFVGDIRLIFKTLWG